MNDAIERLRRQCQPVQEDTPVPPREHRITVDRRDVLALLNELDALEQQLLFVSYGGGPA